MIEKQLHDIDILQIIIELKEQGLELNPGTAKEVAATYLKEIKRVVS